MKRLLLAALILPALSTPSFANPPLPQAKDIVMLPASAIFGIEKNGKFAVVTDTGRYIITGKVYDVWAKKEITNLEEARISAHYIPMDKTDLGFEDLAPISIGNGTKAITMFSDPACQYCKEIINEARSSLPEGYRLDVLMIPVLTPESGKRVVEYQCASDPAAAWKAAVSGDMKTPLSQKPREECDLDVITKRRSTAQFLGARNVPFLIRDDGLTNEGKPSQGLRVWIESNRNK